MAKVKDVDCRISSFLRISPTHRNSTRCFSIRETDTNVSQLNTESFIKRKIFRNWKSLGLSDKRNIQIFNRFSFYHIENKFHKKFRTIYCYPPPQYICYNNTIIFFCIFLTVIQKKQCQITLIISIFIYKIYFALKITD